MKIRVLVEQGRPGGDGYIASGAVVDVDNATAKGLLNRGEAEAARSTADTADNPPRRAKRTAKPGEA